MPGAGPKWETSTARTPIDGGDDYRLTDRNRSVGLLDDPLYLFQVEGPQRGGAHVPLR